LASAKQGVEGKTRERNPEERGPDGGIYAQLDETCRDHHPQKIGVPFNSLSSRVVHKAIAMSQVPGVAEGYEVVVSWLGVQKKEYEDEEHG
jgi:hypothetical protein